MQRVFRLFLAWVIMIALCSLVFPASAQESTPDVTLPPVVVEQPPVTVIDQTSTINTLLVVFGAIVTVLFVVFGAIVRPLVAGAIASIPPAFAEMLLSAGNAGISAIEDYAEKTVNTQDDIESAKFRKAFDELREEVKTLQQQQQREGTNTPPQS